MAKQFIKRHLTWRRAGLGVGLILVVGLIIGLGQMTGSDASAADEEGQMLAAAVPQGEADDWFTLEPMSFDLNVSASGELAAKDQVEVKSQVGGKPAIIKIVDEGTYVEEGDLIVKLDSDEIEEDVEQRRLKVENARAEKIVAEQNLAIQRDEAQSERQKAEVELNLAKLELQMWNKGEAVQKRRKLDLALETAKRELKQAKRDLKLSEKLHKQQFISLNELEEDQIAKIEADNALATAKLDLKVWNQYKSSKQLQEYESDVNQAKAELKRTISKNQNKTEQLTSKLETKKRLLSLRQRRLEDEQRQLEATTIHAPKAGLVVYASSVGRRRRHGDPITEGTQIRYNETIILLPDTKRMVAELMVHEALIGQVETGQKVNVSIESRPNRPVTGEVISKAVTPEGGGWLNPNLREYKVRVALPEGVKNLKPAMRCKAKIRTGTVSDQLAVPIQAVFSEKQQRYCYIPGPEGKVRREPVDLGRASDTHVVIDSGLDKGSHVLLRPPNPGEVLDATL